MIWTSNVIEHQLIDLCDIFHNVRLRKGSLVFMENIIRARAPKQRDIRVISYRNAYRTSPLGMEQRRLRCARAIVTTFEIAWLG